MPNQPQNDKRVNTTLEQAIRAILTDRPIAYHPAIAEAVGSATAGIFLSQLLYWTPRAQDKDGWIYKTRDEIRQETALTRWEQEGARKVLRKAGVLKEKRQGIGNVLYYRVDIEALVRLLGKEERGQSDPEDDSFPSDPDQPTNFRKEEKPPSGRRKNLPLEGGKPATQKEEKPPPIYVTENTTENTTESVVVDQLKTFGISSTTATRFAKNYPEEYLTDKLALAQWLVSEGSLLVRKNPAGWLKTAIEEDFQPANNYEIPSARKTRTEKQATIAAAEAEKRKQAEQEYRQAQEEVQRRVRENHPPEPVGKDGLTTESAWDLTLKRLQAEVSTATFQTWLRNTMLVSLKGETAIVVVPNQNTADWIERRLYQSLIRTFTDVIGQEDIDFRFIPALTQPLTIS